MVRPPSESAIDGRASAHAFALSHERAYERAQYAFCERAFARAPFALSERACERALPIDGERASARARDGRPGHAGARAPQLSRQHAASHGRGGLPGVGNSVQTDVAYPLPGFEGNPDETVGGNMCVHVHMHVHTAPRRRSPEAPERPHHGCFGVSPWPIHGSILTILGFHFVPIYEGKMNGIGHAAPLPTVHRTAPEAPLRACRGTTASARMCTCTGPARGSFRALAAPVRGRCSQRTADRVDATRARSIRMLASGRPEILGTHSVTHSHEWCDSSAGRPRRRTHVRRSGQPFPPHAHHHLAPAVQMVTSASRHLGASSPECRLTYRGTRYVATAKRVQQGYRGGTHLSSVAYYATPACPYSVPRRYRACVGCAAKPHVNAGRRGAETCFPCLTCGDAEGILYYADECGRKRRLRLAHGRDGGVPRTPGKGARSAVGTSSASTLAPRVLMKGTVM